MKDEIGEHVLGESKETTSALDSEASQRGQDLWSGAEGDAGHAGSGMDDRVGARHEHDGAPGGERTADHPEWFERMQEATRDSYGSDQRGVHDKLAETKQAISEAEGIGGALEATAKGLEFTGEAVAALGDGFEAIGAEGVGESVEATAQQRGASELTEMAAAVGGEALEMIQDAGSEFAGGALRGVGEATAGMARSADDALEAFGMGREGRTSEARDKLVDALVDGVDALGDAATELARGVAKGTVATGEGLWEMGRELVEGAGEVAGLRDDEERRRGH